MEANSQLIKIISEWVKIDNEMRTLKSEILARKKKQKLISVEFHNKMEELNIDIIDINGGRIERVCRKTKKPYTKKMLLNLSAKLYKENASMANELNTFIQSEQEVVVKYEFVRKFDK